MSAQSGLLTILPALVLVATGVALILWQAFAKRDGAGQPYWLLSLAGLLAAALAAGRLPPPCQCAAAPLSLGGSVLGDSLARFLELLLLATAAGVVLLMRGYARQSGTERGEHYALLLFSVAGMLGLASAAELIALFVALEIMSVSLYALTGLRRTQSASQEAALKYFVTGAFSSAFLLYGIALLYGVSGTTTLVGLAAALSVPAQAPGVLAVALGLVLMGLGFKVASVPFHMWVPDVYQGAPTTVTALMAAAVKTAAFGALVRVLLVGLAPLAASWRPAVAILAVVTMVVGNLAALAQTNLKRLLAYSSIAHAGYVLTAFVASASVAVPAVVFYLVGYAAVSLGAFGALALLARGGQEPTTLADLSGLAERRPLLAAALTIFMISLTGVPVSAGFMGKLLLFRAAVSGGWTLLALVGVVMSLVSAYYYLRVVVVMYMKAPTDAEWAAGDGAARLALAAAVAVTLWLGIAPGAVLEWARVAALSVR